MGHLVSQHGKLVHLHLGLIATVDALVCYKARRGNHVCSHTIANEENYVLGLADGGKVSDQP